jgi:uncharacterized protein
MGTISRYAHAWAAGDLATVVDSYATDIVVHYGGTSPFAGTHTGRDRFVEVLIETASRSSRELISVDQVHDDGETGAIFATERILVGPPGDRRPVTIQRALRFRVADDRITECWLFDHDQHLLDRSWSTAEG